ncbi:MAG: hypothetical protein IPL99_11940 [Candidatus Competibacteraceae bacterium]|nr:hypothetical protein [Candidatus Competibacteraceae bacterium]
MSRSCAVSDGPPSFWRAGATALCQTGTSPTHRRERRTVLRAWMPAEPVCGRCGTRRLLITAADWARGGFFRAVPNSAARSHAPEGTGATRQGRQGFGSQSRLTRQRVLTLPRRERPPHHKADGAAAATRAGRWTQWTLRLCGLAPATPRPSLWARSRETARQPPHSAPARDSRPFSPLHP